MKTFMLSFCVLCATALLACGDDDNDDIYDAYYDVPVTTAYWEDWSTSAVYGMSDPFYDPYYYSTFLSVSHEQPGDPETAAIVVAENPERYFGDDCVTVERDGSEVTMKFSSCVVPFTNEMIEGTLHASYRTEGDDIGFDIESMDLVIDRREIEFTAHATYTATDGARTVRYTSQRSSTIGDKSIEGEFETVLTWTAGSNCVTRNSTGEVMAYGGTFGVQVDDYTRCFDRCPSSGMVTMNDRGELTTLTFTGRTDAMLERNNGDTEIVDLHCDD